MRSTQRFPSASVPLAVCLLFALSASWVWANGNDAPYDLEDLGPGERALVALPIQFQVLPENRLYLFGERMDSVSLTTALGDSLYLNGIAILPLVERVYPREPVSEETYLAIYGGVPCVQELMRGGGSARAAAGVYESAREEIIRLTGDAYSTARAAGRSQTEAVLDAYGGLSEFDTHGLIDWSQDSSASEEDVRFAWKGMIWPKAWIVLRDAPERTEPRVPSERDKRLKATQLYELLGMEPGPCWYLIGGASQTLCGSDVVARALDQLELSRQLGETQPGPLLRARVREMLAREREED